MTAERIPGGGDPAGAAFDTSWLHEASDPSGGDRVRGRSGKRRTRRCTLSPSIGSKSFMSGVDFDDPENFPNIPVAGGVTASGGSVGVETIAAEDGSEAPAISPTRQSLSPSPDSDARDSRLPDPSVVANLFDDEETTPEPKLPPPLGLLGSLGNQNQARSAATERDRSGKKSQGQGSAKCVKGSSRDAHTSVGVENRRPSLDLRPGVAAEGAATAVTSSPPSVVSTSATSRAPSSTTATKMRLASTTTTITPGGGKGEEKGPLPSPPASASAAAPAPEPAPVAAPPPIAAKQKKSRNSRRRSILMPAEAQSFVESDLGGSGVEVAPPQGQRFADEDAGAPPPPTAAAAAAAATTDREGKPKPSSGRSGGGVDGGTGGGGKTAAEDFPLTSVNATSCLSRPLATQRGWRSGSGDDTKSLVRAYYAAAKGSQRARRVAARLFCLTGFCLLPVSPDDARVLCEAAGDSLEWGLEEKEMPRLVTRPCVRETRDQKRELVRRIKPLFELMDKATRDEKRAAEANTGVVSRKAAADGYCYEDRKTKTPVDPDVYKAMYTVHIHALRAARIKEFALLRANVCSPPEVAVAGSTSGLSLPEAVTGSISGSGKKKASAATSTPALAVPAGGAGARSPEKAAAAAAAVAALTAQPLPLETKRVEADRALETAKTGKGPDGDAVASSVETQAEEGRLSNAVPGARGQGAAHSGDGADSFVAGKGIAVGEVGAGGEGTPRAVTPSRVPVGTEESADGKGVATPAVAGGVVGRGADGTEANGEVKTPAGVQSPSREVERNAAVAEGIKGCGGLGGDPLVVSGGTVWAAEDSLSSAAGGSSLDSPIVDNEGTAEAQPAPASPLGLELSGVVVVETGVSRVASIQEDDGHQPDSESSGFSGGELAIRTSPPPLPLVGEPTASPPTIAAGPKHVSPKHAEAELRSDGDCGGDGSPSRDGQTQEVSAVGAGGAQAATSPLVPSRDSSNTTPRGVVSGDGNRGRVGEAPWTPLSLSPLAFPERSEEADGEESGRQVAGHGDTVQVSALARKSSAPMDGSNTRAGGAPSKAVLSSGEAAEETEELAALEERLWSGWDALLAEYHAAAALVKSRRNRHGVAPVTSVPPHENSTVSGPFDAAAAPPVATPNGAMVATRSVSEGQEDAPASRVSTASSPPIGSVIETGGFPRRGGGSASSSLPQQQQQQSQSTERADYVGVLSPSSPLLPLLDLRLSEEEELFESRELRGAVEGTRASKATTMSTRRRSPAQRFSAEKRDGGLNQQQQQQQQQQRRQQQRQWQWQQRQRQQQQRQQPDGRAMGSAVAEAAAGESVAREAGGAGEEEGGTCSLCCRKESDRILCPCQHVACGTCVEKLRVQAEQSGEALSCPWDRQPVDEIDVFTNV